jgi:glycosyltransferase involved in cell wall biosynthesis
MGQRIAIFSSMAEFPWGGSEELWAQMADAALEDGHEVLALIPKWDPRHPKVQALTEKGLKVSEWAESWVTPERNETLGRNQFYPYDELIRFKPTRLCFSHGGLLDLPNGHLLLALLVLTELTVPLTVIIQANTDLYLPSAEQRGILRQYFERATRVYFVSQENLDFARIQLAHPIPNGELINNPVNLTDYSEVPWPISATARFATVARFDVWAKGHDLLFEVLSQWRERDYLLSLYGAGRDEGYVRELIRLYGLEDKVVIPGQRTDVRSIWAENEMLVLPSRLEGTPLVLYEAMLLGRPAVVTAVGGNADWIQEGESGFVAEAATVELLSAAMERAWRNRPGWREMGSASREHFLKSHEIRSGETLLKGLL